MATVRWPKCHSLHSGTAEKVTVQEVSVVLFPIRRAFSWAV